MNDRWVRIRFVLILVTAFFAFIAMVLSLVSVAYVVDAVSKIRQTQITGTPLGRKIEQSTSDTAITLQILQDCLDPNGVCGKASSENQKIILLQVREDFIAAVACADQPGIQTEDQIDACVMKSRP